MSRRLRSTTKGSRERESQKKEFAKLRRNYEAIREENAILLAELEQSYRLVDVLKREKLFLLQKLLGMEGFHPDSDTESDDLSSEEGEGYHPAPSKKRKVSRRKQRTSSGLHAEEEGMCVAVVKNRPCKSKALEDSDFCWHHSPLDPKSNFTYCKFLGGTRSKKCSIPISKDQEVPYCKYHQNKVEKVGEGDESPDSAETSEGFGEDMDVEGEKLEQVDAATPSIGEGLQSKTEVAEGVGAAEVEEEDDDATESEEEEGEETPDDTLGPADEALPAEALPTDSGPPEDSKAVVMPPEV